MDTPSQGHTEARPRTSQGRFTVRAGTAERDAKACRMRVAGLTYDQIAGELGFRDRSGARRAVKRALAATAREPAGELIALELERLDHLTRQLQRALVDISYAVTAGGKIVCHPATGELLRDYGPVIAAARELRQVSESRRKLLGLDAPAKTRIEIFDDQGAEETLSKLEAQLAAIGDGLPPLDDRLLPGASLRPAASRHACVARAPRHGLPAAQARRSVHPHEYSG